MWVQLDAAGWFRLLSASDIWRWWLKGADLYALKLSMFLWPLNCITSFSGQLASSNPMLVFLTEWFDSFILPD